MGGLLGNFDDPTTQLGAGLLAGNSPFFGVNLGNAMQQTNVMQMAARKDARAEEQAQMAQLASSYKMLKDQDEEARQTANWTGTPYTPNPLLAMHEQKLAQLLGQPYHPNTAAAANSAVPQAPQAPQQVPPSVASNYSSAVKPEFQASGPTPQPQAPQAPQQQLTMPQLAQAAGIDPRVAADWSRTPQGRNELYKAISEKFGPKVVNNVLMQYNPDGTTKFLGGAVSKDTVPVISGPNGLQAQKIGGLQQILADQAGATEGATQAAKAPYTPITVPNQNGSATTMMLDRFMGGAPQGQLASLSVTQGPRPGSGVSFGAGTSQTPGDRSQQEDLGKYFGNQFITTQQAGQSAASNRQKMDRMQQLMEGINTTGMTPTGMHVASLARGIGIELDPKLPQKEAFQAMAGQLALELRNPAGGAGMPGSLSDNDLKFLKSITPGLAQTPEGRKLMFETKSKLLQRDEDIAQLARSYYKQNGKMDAGFDQIRADYANQHPMFPSAEPPSNRATELDQLVEQYRSKK